ncbi:DNA polymerase III subunit alpha [Candidatus Jorgensenbacteria bacterium RIFCSPLOWO2_02_FULL_45_12]|uniref:DNA polymerase III subunit alpha n=1 Tax=Candidatus Jorgensenbacteria bacterium RIFCSPHIGHO2_02_FULL_45_20 TaxID=1798470 RepID=A0A1F6BPH7_9BACT|nr:MAG: DNA polymerase III subunit alpha [Candidatus Jorgensenbacteria bacterium RIFCSPHIGHO2_02_FULL_45_20]OGG42216.1 MAG: DNA polymerase III subunit alpha [Candidatus Jorgensenbacteria bacterium RIFCSPLOWO2_02_FULL_45_12]
MDTQKTKFTHLHVHSHYSLLDGLAKIDELLCRAKEFGMDSLALTDHGNLYGAIEFYEKAKKAGIKPILGVEAYLAPNGRLNKTPKVDETRYHLTILAKNRAGWKNLIQLVTKSHLEGFYYKPRIDKELLKELHEGLICLSGCFSGEIAKLLSRNNISEAESVALWYKSVFGDDFYIEIQAHTPEINKLAVQLSEKTGIPLVATQDVHYVRPEDKTAHEILLAVQTNSKLDDEDRLSLKKFDISFLSGEEMEKKFKEIPEAVTNTALVADKCNLELELGKPILPSFPIPKEFTSSFEYLKHLVYERVGNRYPQMDKAVEERINTELSVIEKTGFADYFLIVQDYTNWAKNHGIVVGPGRGSAAGSIVSYILNVTNLNPLKYDLLFERFLNPDRIQIPDIDLDFTDTRRDEVLSYVREKYGADRVAQIITFGTMLSRAAIRDAGRAMGLSYGFCDQLAKLIPFTAPATPIKKALEMVPELKKLQDTNKDAKELLDAAMRLEGTVRHASVHACGVVITPKPLTEYVALQKAPQGENTVITQTEMHGVEDIGLLKMDFLGLKNLTIIERALKLIKENKGVVINIDAIPLDDKKTFELFASGETTGVFQLESAGMRRYLKELKPSELEDIIAMVSLYRPGPMELIPNYIDRKFGREPVTYIHPLLEPILKKTYGVGIYQEQMMRIARDLAGFSLAEADTLRKAIGKKIKELLDEQKEKLISGMIKNGISEKISAQIWELFPPFARYGFNRSHAACYALISYQTAYLKANYPVEFMASLLNVSGTEVERVNFLIGDARRLGIKVLPPDINASFRDFTVEGGNIRFGLLAVKNVGANIVNIIIEERARGGEFANITDVLLRVKHRDMNKKSLESLIKCGAFDSFGLERGQALENIDDFLRFNQAAKKMDSSKQFSLFGDGTATLASLKMRPGKPAAKSASLAWEKELLGFYLTDHPFSPYSGSFGNSVKTARELHSVQSSSSNGASPRVKTAGVVANVQKILTKNGEQMLFVSIEDLTGSIELLVFPRTLDRTKNLWEEGKVVLAGGRLSAKNGEAKLICDEARAI